MLRDYQAAAVDAFFKTAREKEHCRTLITLPTGSGKSHVLAEIANRVALRPDCNVLIVQHRKELIEQNADKLKRLGLAVHLFSAGLGRKETGQITLAGIQSIYKKSHILPFIHLVIIDEAHLLPPNGEGMYLTLLSKLLRLNPSLKLLGLTATPFRLKTGALTTDDGLFTDNCYSVPLNKLINDGYLVPVTTKGARSAIETQDIKKRAGEYVLEDAARKFTDQKTRAVIREVLELARDRKSILVFCSSVAHADNFTAALRLAGQSVDCIVGDTLLRGDIIDKFKRQQIRFLVNVETLTTGFDAPSADCIVLLRPTESTGLYVQIIGRGMRPCDNKKDCLVLDFAGNVERHGPINKIRFKKIIKTKDGEVTKTESLETLPHKICPECLSAAPARATLCPDCLFVFGVEKHGTKASSGDILADDDKQEIDFEVERIEYAVHHKKGKPPIFKITYHVDKNPYQVSEYLCLEHQGYAQTKAKKRWQNHAIDKTMPPPSTADEALFLAETEELKKVTHIKVTYDYKFYNVVAWKYGDEPSKTLEGLNEEINDDVFD